MLLFLLFASISAHTLRSASMVEQMYLDPVAFAQSFENASPEAVRSVISMINDLIAEGAGKKTDLIAAHDNAVQATSDASGALDIALSELEYATGERIEGDDKVTAAKGTVAQKQSAEATATGIKADAKGALDAAQAWMDTEVARVDGEKTALEEVLEILGNLPEGRRLLSTHGSLIPVGMIAAAAVSDPAAVAEVVGLVNDLIQAGEDVRTTVTGARDDASSAYDNANTEWKWAVARTVQAQDALAEREGEVESLLAVERQKNTVHVEKRDIHDNAVNVEADKKKQMDTEVPVLDHEDEQLKRVVEILNGLL
jgi:hypothetical protein